MKSPNIVGNYYDKYGTKNPIARYLMSSFLSAVTGMFREIAPRTVLEVGCGEGKLADHLVTKGPRPDRFEAVDLDLSRIEPNLDASIRFHQADAYALPFKDAEFELVVCCEVLEHIEYPTRALSELSRVAGRALIVSTPREPLWRVMNLARGKYITDWGNTPGHIQHFSRDELVHMVGKVVSIERVESPVPWTVVLGKPRR